MVKEANLIAERLPPLSAALVLETVRLETFRDQYGMLQCSNRNIGPMRKKLGAVPLIAPISALDDPEKGLPAAEIARDQARVLLAEMCRVCPYTECRMKTWQVKKQSP